MKSKASAPGKVILFGEHFVVYGARAILCAIDRRVVVSAETVPQKTISIKSEIGEFSGGAGAGLAEADPPLRPLLYLARKLIGAHDHAGGMSVSVESAIPRGAGLGSSSACCVAGAAAISALFGRPGRDEVLRLATEAEKTVYPDSSGADCAVCTYGGIGRYSKESGFERMGSTPSFKLVIADSKVEHSTGAMVSNVRRFKEENEERFAHMCSTEDRLAGYALSLIEKNDLAGLGRCMAENQALLEAIGVSNERLEDMVRAANETAFGGKITGAGGGGCVFSLNDHTNVQDTVRRLRGSGIECFPAGIDFKGLDTF